MILCGFVEAARMDLIVLQCFIRECISVSKGWERVPRCEEVYVNGYLAGSTSRICGKAVPILICIK